MWYNTNIVTGILMSVILMGNPVFAAIKSSREAQGINIDWNKFAKKFGKIDDLGNQRDGGAGSLVEDPYNGYQRPQTYKNSVKPSNKFKDLIFSDEFNELDFDKWRPEITAGGGGNWEFQFYSNDRKTSYVNNGKLHLRPIFTSDALGTTEEEIKKDGFALDLWGNAPGNQCTANGFFGCQRKTEGKNIINPMASAQLRSVDGFNFKYGKVEIRAKMPKGEYLWPALWLLPKHHSYGGWPASGEIDIIESRGNMDDCYGDGVSTVSSALHWGLNYTNNQYPLTHGKYTLPKGKTFNDDFHTFTMEWTKEYIRTWVDNQHLIMNVEFKQPMHNFGNFTGEFNPWEQRPINAPFDQKFYLIINLAVGGTGGFFPDGPDPKNSPPKLQTYCKLKQKNKKYQKPYSNQSPNASYDFLNNKKQWLPTWKTQSDQSHLIIDYIRVYSENKY